MYLQGTQKLLFNNNLLIAVSIYGEQEKFQF